MTVATCTSTPGASKAVRSGACSADGQSRIMPITVASSCASVRATSSRTARGEAGVGAPGP